MYLWRKHATNDWLRKHSEGLETRYGAALAITERPGQARSLIEVSCKTALAARAIQKELGGAIKRLPANWLQQATKQNRAQPLRIGSRVIVNRTAGPKSDRRRTIVIPAEAAFGTGDHATTAMCLRMLERVTRKKTAGWKMLDAGTGSGILAIAGKFFGASRVVAIENDPLACRVARRNARANGASTVVFRTGDVLKEKLGEQFDIITANLFSELLAAALPKWSRHLKGDGCLILSGVLRSQESGLRRALRQNGFAIREIRRRGKWIALLAAATPKNS